MTEESNKEIQAIQKRAKMLSEVISRTLAPLVGIAVAGPIGAVAGGVAGTLIKYSLEEFMDRWLTPKEVKRIGTSTEYIIKQINNRLNQGENLNTGLFERKASEISDAEELFEGVLLKCKNQYQEKKLKYMSNIFVSSAFDPNISSIMANQILTVAEGLTYRKLCVLAFYGIKDEGCDTTDLMIEPYSWYKNKQFLPELEVLKQNIFELMNQGLITNDNTVTFSSDDILPGKYMLTDIGQIYFKALGLSEIDRHETDFIHAELKYRKELGLNEEGKTNGKDPG
jgi:hypothetical protein